MFLKILISQEWLSLWLGLEKLTIAFPDEGATKRFGSFFQEYPVITCTKVRSGNQRQVVLKDGIAQDRHIVIVDDLVQTGGTLLECKDTLIHYGALSVSAYVTHAVFPCRSWEKFIPKEGEKNFSHFFIMNTIPSAQQLVNIPPFHVISIAPCIVDAISTFY